MFGFVKEVSNANIYCIRQISVTPFSLWGKGIIWILLQSFSKLYISAICNLCF